MLTLAGILISLAFIVTFYSMFSEEQLSTTDDEERLEVIRNLSTTHYLVGICMLLSFVGTFVAAAYEVGTLIAELI